MYLMPLLQIVMEEMIICTPYSEALQKCGFLEYLTGGAKYFSKAKLNCLDGMVVLKACHNPRRQ
jgi:hypothetical protein